MSVAADDLTTVLPRWGIPDEWSWVSISEVGAISTGNTPPKKDPSNYGDHIPLVKPPELVDRPIWAATDGLSKRGAVRARLLPEGAVLVSCIGGLGKTGIAKVPLAFNQQINAIVFNRRVLPEYGFYYVQTLKPWLYDMSSATTLPIVNKGKFQKAPFPLAPLDQQRRIVAEIEKQFSRLDQAVASLKRVKANLKRYKAAVLKAAVEGKLTKEWRKQNLPAPESRPGKFYAYAILCDDDSIYVGHTQDIEKRWKEHREGNGVEWTRKHKPLKIAHYEEFNSRKEASEREKWLKTGYGRKWLKRELAAGRTRQAGHVEPASKLLERILAERRTKWEEAELTKMKAKGKVPMNDNWKKKYKGPIRPVTDNHFILPHSWTRASVDQLASSETSAITDGPFGSNLKTAHYTESGPRVIRLQNIKAAEWVNAMAHISYRRFKQLEKHSVRPGDIVIAALGRPAPRACMIPSRIGQAIVKADCIRFRVDKQHVAAKYLMYALNSEPTQKCVASIVHGVGRPRLNLSEIKSIELSVPPFEEQKAVLIELEHKLSISDAVVIEIDMVLSHSADARQAVLQKAFNGGFGRK